MLNAPVEVTLSVSELDSVTDVGMVMLPDELMLMVAED